MKIEQTHVGVAHAKPRFPINLLSVHTVAIYIKSKQDAKKKTLGLLSKIEIKLLQMICSGKFVGRRFGFLSVFFSVKIQLTCT